MNFVCPKCGAEIIETPRGFETGCEHYPLEHRKRVHAGPVDQMGVEGPPPWEEIDSDIREDGE